MIGQHFSQGSDLSDPTRSGVKELWGYIGTPCFWYSCGELNLELLIRAENPVIGSWARQVRALRDLFSPDPAKFLMYLH